MLSSEKRCLVNCLGWQIVKEKNMREKVSSQRPTHWTQRSLGSLLWTRLTLFGDLCLPSFTPGMRGSSHSRCCSTIPTIRSGGGVKPFPLTAPTHAPFHLGKEEKGFSCVFVWIFFIKRKAEFNPNSWHFRFLLV